MSCVRSQGRCVCVCVCECTHYIYIYVCNTHTHTHTHIHTYTHTHTVPIENALHRNLQNSLEFQSCFIQKTGIDLVILYTNSLIFSLFCLSEFFFPPLSTGEPIEGALRRFKIAVSRSGHLMELRRRRYAVCFHFFF